MADISEELITYLKTVSGVTALVGTGTSARIYDEDGLPAGVLNPTQAGPTRGAISFVKQSDNNSGHLGGRSTLNSASFAMTCYAVTPSARNALASALWDALAPEATQTMGSTAIAEIHCQNKSTTTDLPASDASDQRIYLALASYTIWYYSA